MHNRMIWSGAALVAGLIACSQRAVTPADSGAGTNPPEANAGVPANQQSDWAVIEKIEAEAKTIAKTGGCTVTGDCRSAPVGSRACGGPRYYMPYCAKTTDSVGLFR